jgi:hypothetical protein
VSEAETMDVLMLVVKKILKEEVRDLFIHLFDFMFRNQKLNRSGANRVQPNHSDAPEIDLNV